MVYGSFGLSGTGWLYLGLRPAALLELAAAAAGAWRVAAHTNGRRRRGGPLPVRPAKLAPGPLCGLMPFVPPDAFLQMGIPQRLSFGELFWGQRFARELAPDLEVPGVGLREARLGGLADL